MRKIVSMILFIIMSLTFLVGTLAEDVNREDILIVELGPYEEVLSLSDDILIGEELLGDIDVGTLEGQELSSNDTSFEENGRGIDIEEHFPDDVFRWYIEGELDSDRDGYLSKSEIKKVTSLYLDDGCDVYGYYIHSLEGIEYFTYLTYLSCSNNALTKLDLSKNKKLKTLYCDENRLKQLNINKNTKLTTLDCSDNCLTKLDVSKNTKLDWLDCSDNKLTKLDVSKNTKLWTLKCNNNKIKTFKYERLTKLSQLRCQNNNLKMLDISKFPLIIKDDHYYDGYYLGFDYGKTKLMNGKTVVFVVPSKTKYIWGSYSSLARQPKKYKGRKIYFDGTIVQVIENGNNISFRIATDNDGDDVFWCSYKKPKNYSRYLEKDKVRIYGVSTGLYTYTSTWGERITIPSCTVDRIEFQYIPYEDDDDDDDY